jgi:hypothetical protein
MELPGGIASKKSTNNLQSASAKTANRAANQRSERAIAVDSQAEADRCVDDAYAAHCGHCRAFLNHVGMAGCLTITAPFLSTLGEVADDSADWRS